MKRRKSLTRIEQIETLNTWMRKKGLGQKQFLTWLGVRGLDISPQYLNDVLLNRKPAGPKFISIFREITGVQLVAGLMEKD